MKETRLAIDTTWDGLPAGSDERASLSLRLDRGVLALAIEAPFHGDPAPVAPPGSLEGLWEYELVELFLLGRSQRYLELEFGPHGHYLVLQLRGARKVERRGIPIDYHAEHRDGRWSGSAQLSAALLPPGLRACNAYAIHGFEEKRRHLACYPRTGTGAEPNSGPDFHRLECFGPLHWENL